MFKLLPPLFLVVPVAWLTIFAVAALNAVTPAIEAHGLRSSTSWTVLAVQGVVTTIFLTPLWRWIWQKVPALNQLWFPDLTGTWEVTVSSNWPRIDHLLHAANGQAEPINMRDGNEALLPALGETNLTAEIRQSWTGISLHMWGKDGTTPISGSRTLVVEPFRENDGRRGLAYLFEQESDGDNVSDDRTFRGAAWVERDRHDPDLLLGRMWSDRMWRRGMNTAANLRFRRTSRKAPKRRETSEAPVGDPGVT